MKTQRHFQRQNLVAALLVCVLSAIALAGCGKREAAPHDGTPPSDSRPTALESALAAWAQGNQATAVSRFLEADWSVRPLFTPGSTLSLSEDQFKKLPAADRQAKSAEVQAQLAMLRELAGAVAQAGRDAVGKNDAQLARKHFTAIQQCGQALAGVDSMLIVKLVGQALQKMADAEMAKLPRLRSLFVSD